MKKTIINVFLLFFSISIFSQETNGIIFRDFIPDTLTSFPRFWSGDEWPGDTLCLDINSDSECEIMLYYNYGTAYLIVPYIEVFNNSNSYLTWAIYDTLNDSRLVWTNNKIFWSYTPDSIENFGFKCIDGTDVNYGWFRAYCTYDDSHRYLIVDKMAFCTIPNYPLLWGQTDVNSVPGETANNKSLVLANNNNKLSITANEQIECIEIFNAKGEPVSNMPNVNSVTAEADISALAAGMYIVRAAFVNGGAATAKFVKQ